MANKIAITMDSTTLNVAEKLTELIKDNLGSESVYIRTKETLEELLQNGTIKDTDRATTIANVLTALNQSLVSGAMQTALQWAGKEADLEMQRLELEYKLGLYNEQIGTQVANTVDVQLAQALKRAELLKNYGVTIDASYLIADNPTVDGKIDKEISVLGQEYTNKTAENSLIGSKTKESQASVHKLVADTYKNYGIYSYTLADTGVTSIVAHHDAGTRTLSDYQQDIAIEQAKGYTYNAWSNAAQSAATMIGTLLTGDVEVKDPDTGENLVPGYVGYWTTTMDKLKNLQVGTTIDLVPPTTPTITTLNETNAVISVAAQDIGSVIKVYALEGTPTPSLVLIAASLANVSTGQTVSWDPTHNIAVGKGITVTLTDQNNNVSIAATKVRV